MQNLGKCKNRFSRTCNETQILLKLLHIYFYVNLQNQEPAKMATWKNHTASLIATFRQV